MEKEQELRPQIKMGTPVKVLSLPHQCDEGENRAWFTWSETGESSLLETQRQVDLRFEILMSLSGNYKLRNSHEKVGSGQ